MGIAGVYPQDVVDAGTLEVGDKVIVIRGNYIFGLGVDELPSGGGGGSSVTIVDNLESTSTTDALSANQGKVLNDRLETVEGNQSNYLTTSTASSTYATIANQRYTFVSDSNTTYIVPASAVTENGRTIIELSNNSLTSITINTATGTGKVVGDSVNISITGTYAAQELFGSGVTLEGDLTFSYQYQTKTLVYKGSNTCKVVG